jgi:hypothetical protein
MVSAMPARGQASRPKPTMVQLPVNTSNTDLRANPMIQNSTDFNNKILLTAKLNE